MFPFFFWWVLNLLLFFGFALAFEVSSTCRWSFFLRCLLTHSSELKGICDVAQPLLGDGFHVGHWLNHHCVSSFGDSDLTFMEIKIFEIITLIWNIYRIAVLHVCLCHYCLLYLQLYAQEPAECGYHCVKYLLLFCYSACLHCLDNFIHFPVL